MLVKLGPIINIYFYLPNFKHFSYLSYNLQNKVNVFTKLLFAKKLEYFSNEINSDQMKLYLT